MAAPLQRVPRVIYQTNKSRRVSRRAYKSIVDAFEVNPEYSYSFYDDARCEALIAQHFPPEVMTAFKSLKAGAAKADLWRYCCLALYGGVYVDMDAAIIGPLSDILEAATPCYFMIDAEANLIQWALAAEPRHPLLQRCVTMATQRVLAREPNIFLATGPSVFTDAFFEAHGEVVYGSRTLDWSRKFAFLQAGLLILRDLCDVYAYGTCVHM